MAFRLCPECGAERTDPVRCMECGRIERTQEQIRDDLFAFDRKHKEDVERLRQQLAAVTAERGALRTESDRARRHPMAPELCPVCEWTNVNLMNYGSAGTSRWMCHGCAATAIQQLAAMTSQRDRFRTALKDLCDRYNAGPWTLTHFALKPEDDQ